MASHSDLIIRKAVESDLDAILNLETEYTLARLDPDQAGKTGFLVSGFPREKYVKFLEYAESFYVALVGGVFAGFTLAYHSDSIQDDEWLNLQIKSKYSKPFILVKQVCVAKAYSGHGIAGKMYGRLFEDADHLPIFGAIVLKPRNDHSIEFHEKLGFTLYMELTPPDGMLRGVWMKPGT